MKLQGFAGITILATSMLISGLVLAQSSGNVKSLRVVGVDQEPPPTEVYQQQQGREVRNYRQQPPLIPHSIDQYQMDLRTNQCLGCHDWTNAGDRGAPTLSMTHYLDRNGTQLDTVAATRWFCNQCHVPQADAPALVGNDFEPSSPSQ